MDYTVHSEGGDYILPAT
ncbi:hypothetical protein VTO73DRAFT_7126 [Trametes versicolor]